jgi:hypothetical protein
MGMTAASRLLDLNLGLTVTIRARTHPCFHKIGDLGGAAPAQGDAGAAVAVIMHDEFAADRLGLEPV